MAGSITLVQGFDPAIIDKTRHRGRNWVRGRHELQTRVKQKPVVGQRIGLGVQTEIGCRCASEFHNWTILIVKAEKQIQGPGRWLLSRPSFVLDCEWIQKHGPLLLGRKAVTPQVSQWGTAHDCILQWADRQGDQQA